eukprot:scaffold100303_cov51-Attheya_sp.AAC.1
MDLNSISLQRWFRVSVSLSLFPTTADRHECVSSLSSSLSPDVSRCVWGGTTVFSGVDSVNLHLDVRNRCGSFFRLESSYFFHWNPRPSCRLIPSFVPSSLSQFGCGWAQSLRLVPAVRTVVFLLELDGGLSIHGGHILTQVGTMESLEYFSFYDAYLTGTIPSQLGNCAKLETLDLSYIDKLGGLVPTELGQFEGLEYFDLDANYFNSTLFISNVFLTNDNSSSVLTSTSWPWPPNLTFSVFTTIT